MSRAVLLLVRIFLERSSPIEQYVLLTRTKSFLFPKSTIDSARLLELVHEIGKWTIRTGFTDFRFQNSRGVVLQVNFYITMGNWLRSGEPQGTSDGVNDSL